MWTDADSSRAAYSHESLAHLMHCSCQHYAPSADIFHFSHFHVSERIYVYLLTAIAENVVLSLMLHFVFVCFVFCMNCEYATAIDWCR